MFGGLTFRLSGKMCCGVVKDSLTVPVGRLASKDTTPILVTWYVAITVFNALKLSNLVVVRD